MKIHYSTPYATDKNIGKAYNEFCDLIPNDNDWIVLRDADSLMLTPDWGLLVEKSLAYNGHEYGLIGCYTNRLKSTHQLHGGKFCNDHELRYHYHIAKAYSENEAKINDIGKLMVAGLFMAFQKKTWKAVGGFDENKVSFDTLFSRKMNERKLKKGLINNLYVYHWYRGWNENGGQWDIKHLL